MHRGRNRMSVGSICAVVLAHFKMSATRFMPPPETKLISAKIHATTATMAHDVGHKMAGV